MNKALGLAGNRTRQSSVISRYPKGIVSFVIKHLRNKPTTPKPMAKPARRPTSLRGYASPRAYLRRSPGSAYMPTQVASVLSIDHTANHPSAASADREQPVEPSVRQGRPTDATRRLEMGGVEGVH